MSEQQRDLEKAPPKRKSKQGRLGRSGEVDLSSLKDLEIGPDWGQRHLSAELAKWGRGAKKGAAHRGRRDQRGAGSRTESSRGQREEGRGGDHRGAPGRSRKGKANRAENPSLFRPTVDVRFFPEERPFRTLTRALRASCKTYELFEIARLVLAKRERFSVMVRRKKDSVEAEKPIYLSAFDSLPFESEEEVIEYAFQNYSDRLLTVEKVPVEPPSGRFQVVNRCTITGVVLGPPNYHRYQTLEREHHRRRLGNRSYESFRSKIEAVRDPEVIDEWVKRMTHGIRYSLNREMAPADNARTFEDFESARHYLVSHFRERIYETAESARFSGTIFDRLPMVSPIRRSIERELEMQGRFPWETANSLRGRFKHMNFDVYKKGSKGITYVCAVRRRAQLSGESLSEPLEEILNAVKARPGIRSAELYSRLCEDISLPEGLPGDGKDLAAVDRRRHFTSNLHWLVSEGYIAEFTDGAVRSSAPPAGSSRDAPVAGDGDARP